MSLWSKPLFTALCRDCKNELTRDERKYYRNRCEQCETAWQERIARWKAGADDPELQKRYGWMIEGHA